MTEIMLWQHRARGTTYEVTGSAMLASDGPVEPGSTLVIYRTGSFRYMARPAWEFYDGRHTAIYKPVDNDALRLFHDQRDGLVTAVDRLLAVCIEAGSQRHFGILDEVRRDLAALGIKVRR